MPILIDGDGKERVDYIDGRFKPKSRVRDQSI
jgi:hypothetical protein